MTGPPSSPPCSRNNLWPKLQVLHIMCHGALAIQGSSQRLASSPPVHVYVRWCMSVTFFKFLLLVALLLNLALIWGRTFSIRPSTRVYSFQFFQVPTRLRYQCLTISSYITGFLLFHTRIPTRNLASICSRPQMSLVTCFGNSSYGKKSTARYSPKNSLMWLEWYIFGIENVHKLLTTRCEPA